MYAYVGIMNPIVVHSRDVDGIVMAHEVASFL